MECPCCSNRSNKCLDSRVGPGSELQEITDNVLNYESKSVEAYSIKRPISQGPQMYNMRIDYQGPSSGNYK